MHYLADLMNKVEKFLKTFPNSLFLAFCVLIVYQF